MSVDLKYDVLVFVYGYLLESGEVTACISGWNRMLQPYTESANTSLIQEVNKKFFKHGLVVVYWTGL